MTKYEPMSWEQREKRVEKLREEEPNTDHKEDFLRGLTLVAASPEPKKT